MRPRTTAIPLHKRGATIGLLAWLAVPLVLSGRTARIAASELSAPVTPAACEALLSLSIPNTVLTSANVVAETATVPAHCRVSGVTSGEPGSTVIVEVRLPDGWNGKLLFTTRQGFMGAVPPVSNLAITQALQRGYATVTTDGGHSGGMLDASFGLDNRPAEIDFGYRGVHLARVVAQAVIAAYYGSGPAHAYYNGCSSSGRYAVQAAERYPEDFDGIVAGAPIVDNAGATVGFNWNMQAMLAAPLPSEKLPVIHKAVLAACDGIDGLVDGLIDDPRQCHFDPTTLACANGDGADCLTAAEVGTLQKIYTGPSRSAEAAEDPGEQIYPGFAPGGEQPDPIGRQGWDAYVTNAGPLQLTLQDQFLRYLAFDPDPPSSYDWRTFNFDTDPQAMETMHEVIDPVQDDLTAFGDAGGKMIIYQGWSDIAESPYRTIQYYQGLRRHTGRRQVEDYARLFMAPGMNHCGGGTGPNKFDALTALEHWVEDGQAPAWIVASQVQASGATRTRPLCPFPQHAAYLGTGSPDDAANFVCAGPPLGTARSLFDGLFDPTSRRPATASTLTLNPPRTEAKSKKAGASH
jgi:feruloyl esterase